MTTKIYQCRNCGYLVAVLRQGDGAPTCCGAPMNCCEKSPIEVLPEKQRPPLDLTESLVGGKPCWQFV